MNVYRSDVSTKCLFDMTGREFCECSINVGEREISSLIEAEEVNVSLSPPVGVETCYLRRLRYSEAVFSESIVP